MLSTIALVLFVLFLIVLIIGNRPVARTRDEVAKALERFLDGDGDDLAWDEFTSVRIKDPYLDRIRRRCAQLEREFPAPEAGRYCGDEGVGVMRAYLAELRGGAA